MGYVELKDIAMQIDSGIDDLRNMSEEDDGKVGADLELSELLHDLAWASDQLIRHINGRMP